MEIQDKSANINPSIQPDNQMFYPPTQLVKSANVQDYERVYREAAADPEKFWEQAAEELVWAKKWNKVLDDSKKPFYSWFVEGKCNLFTNALERHMGTPVEGKIAFAWEGEDGEKRTYTYKQLLDEANKFSAALKSLGVGKGDRVCVYLPNIPEVVITMLACVKIGAVHSVVYAGFSADALRSRIQNAEPKLVVTADSSVRRGKLIPLKEVVDEALSKDCPTVEKCIVVNNKKRTVTMRENRDFWYSELMKKDLAIPPTEIMDSEDTAFLLFNSGTLYMKNMVHCHGGYMVGVHRTIKWVFDLKPDDVYWCTADAAWITGHSYVVYGPLMAGVTSVMYEGVPDYPREDRVWEMLERYKVTIFYTAPTLIRMMAKYGDAMVSTHNFSALRLLGSVGEPISPQTWLWYYEHVGGKRCPIMDTWWQTETGMHVITPLPPVPLKPGSAFKPFPGILADVVDAGGKPQPIGTTGFLAIKNSWPAQMKTVFHNPQAYVADYYEKIPGWYATGDLAHKDADGYFWIQGRADDVLKISGHRISTAEIENAIISYPAVSEVGVIGKPHEIKGEVAKAFIVLKPGFTASDKLVEEIKLHIRKTVGPLAVTDEIAFVNTLPRTRSGKLLRRVLRAQELGQDPGDTSVIASEE